MFQRGNKRNFNRNKGPRNNNWGQGDRQGRQWDDIPAENPAFEEYYRGQNVCPPEEFDEFLATLRRQLPLTFRINGRGRFADALRTKLETDFFADFASGPLILDGEVIDPPTPLSWYPDKLAWQLDFSRSQLRKIPKLEALHEFMKRETHVGAITRQEAVSMVPPLFLDVQPHHRVLDMCAAPGSKTQQLLEALHATNIEPTGVVVANDADVQRCNMLTHQTQRMRSPCFLVTNHEAQNFPILWDLDPSRPDLRIEFDRILCDVPCSGDGTLRKQPDIWRKWTTNQGNGLHLIQTRITLRGCELLKVGGRLVYSTCTFNPIEDEAVVAEVLRRTKSSMRLVDVSAELTALKRLPGLKTWKVKDQNRWYTTWEEGQHGHKLHPSMFPPKTQQEADDLGLERCMRFLPHHQNTGGFFVCVLEKVAPIDRVKYPSVAEKYQNEEEEEQEQAVIEGGDEVKKEEEEEKAKATQDPTTTAMEVEGEGEGEEKVQQQQQQEQQPQRRQGWAPPKILPEWGVRGGGGRNRDQGVVEVEGTSADANANLNPKQNQNKNSGRWRGLDPIVPFVLEGELKEMSAAYGFALPCPILKALVSRSTEARPKKLTYINAGCKELLLMDFKEQLKVVNGGVKVFERQEKKGNLLNTCYRISQEGLPLLLPFIGKQRFQPTLEEFVKIITDRNVALSEDSKVHITRNGGGGEGESKDHGGEEVVEVKEEVLVEVKEVIEEDGDSNKEGSGEDEAAEEHPNKKMKKERFVLSDEFTRDQLRDVQLGCCVATLREGDATALGLAEEGSTEGGLASNAAIAVTCWRGRGTLNVLVSKEECSQMAERIQAAIAAVEEKKRNMSKLSTA